jgi:cytochrome c oxidase assembly protein subunit 15
LEYVHRLLGRLIGLAFALPLLWFAWKRAIPRGYGWRLTGLFVLGGLQGVIGWWMVASGLVDRPRSATSASQFTFSWPCSSSAADLDGSRPPNLDRDPASRRAGLPVSAAWALSLLGLQLMFGAYVAGLDAGYAFNSWPKMGEEWFPAGTPMLTPFLVNLVDNAIVVQFVHRWLAWASRSGRFVLAWSAWRRGLPVQPLPSPPQSCFRSCSASLRF